MKLFVLDHGDYRLFQPQRGDDVGELHGSHSDPFISNGFTSGGSGSRSVDSRLLDSLLLLLKF